MDIKINNKKFLKDDLITLIQKNKLQTIIHIRSTTNISLKDAKEIVDNLSENPNYYDNSIIKIAEKKFIEGETITLDLKNTTNKNLNYGNGKKAGSHAIKNPKTNKKWIYFLGLILIILLLYFFVSEGLISLS